TFNKNCITGLHKLRNFFCRLLRRLNEEPLSTGLSGRGGQLLCVALNSDDYLDAGFGNRLPAIAMQLGALLTELEHFTRNDNPSLEAFRRNECPGRLNQRNRV